MLQKIMTDILDKPVDGEFVWFDKDKLIFVYQNGTQVIGTISASALETNEASIKRDFIRECRNKYYLDRYGDDYRQRFEEPVAYWEKRLSKAQDVIDYTAE